MAIPHATVERVLEENKDHDCSEGGKHVCVRITAIADLPTRFGDFQVVAFHSPFDGKEHAALVRGDPLGQQHVPVRLHSECLTGDALGSLRCDCRDQLEQALKEIGKRDLGIVLYLRQEGRGIGFENKIKAYQLQEQGLDTIEANRALGFRPDERDYEVAAHMLNSLNVRSIQLMSNNPDKIADLKFHGIEVEGRIPIVIPPNPHNRRYLETKRTKAGHLLGPSSGVEFSEQLDNAGADEAPPSPS
ncbi:MAG: GTP cyclohydrolase II [Euryarchaeota archaeon]|nr:GTP cyclohydrolase II [Euryarchaeota archaeon]MDE1837092.1 GTP cyclohydrolase II [Euryarchaeota archaeon]MDE1879696.1 GTP cyclohydrolase II [Euryarchaeota archaeon]MDE2045222.1 GTP cyclohydrolase II [Thermoplasmata archaeon]